MLAGVLLALANLVSLLDLALPELLRGFNEFRDVATVTFLASLWRCCWSSCCWRWGS